jgi:hypothetical protein
MSRKITGASWRLQAVTHDGAAELPEPSQRGFHDAGELLQQPGAFDTSAIVVDAQGFSDLTGFHPQAGELITATAVRRAAEAATAGRAKALANCRGGTGADYASLGVFLRVCAAHGLALRAEAHLARRSR